MCRLESGILDGISDDNGFFHHFSVFFQIKIDEVPAGSPFWSITLPEIRCCANALPGIKAAVRVAASNAAAR